MERLKEGNEKVNTFRNMSSRSYLFRGTGKRQRVFNAMKCQLTCQIQNEIGT